MKPNVIDFFNINSARNEPSPGGSRSVLEPILAFATAIGITAIGYYLTRENPPTPLQSRVSLIRPAAEPVPLTDEGKLTNLLEEWNNNPLCKGNKNEAIKRIKRAFQEKSRSLTLNQLDLTILPEEVFCFIPSLTSLDLNNNKLTTLNLPPSLSSLAHLNLSFNKLTTLNLPPSLPSLAHLDLSDNKLTTLNLPPSLPSLAVLDLSFNKLTTLNLPPSLPSLAHLDLSHNKLTTLNLTQSLSSLTWLDLSDNELTTLNLPPSLPSLADFQLSNNQNLNSIPMSLAECSRLTFIDSGNTQIPRDIINTILSSIQDSRSNQSSERLPNQLNLWCKYAGIDLNSLNAILDFTDKEKGYIAEWLHRLARTKDFQHCQKELAKKVCDILKDVPNDQFKLLFIDQIAANNTDCGDRAAMGLNEIYVSWKISFLREDASLKEKLEIIVRASKTLALRKVLIKIMDKAGQNNQASLEESTEIFLYYESILVERLELETAIRSMLYSRIGRRDWIQERELIESVKATYLDEVINLPAFKDLIKQDEQLQNELDEIQDGFGVQLEILEERNKSDNEGYYLQELRNIRSNLESALADRKKRWLNDHLEP